MGPEIGHGRRIAIDRVFTCEGCQAEVSKLRVAARRDENVLRFDVAMEDAGRVRGCESVSDACQEIRDLPPCRTRRRRPVLERPAIDHFGDEVRMAIRLASLVHGDDVGMIQ